MASIYKDVPHLAHEQNDWTRDLAVEVPEADRRELRALGNEIARITGDPANQQRSELWRAVNDLEPARPALWVNEVCWNEMEADPELQEELRVRCTSEFCRRIESELRQTIFTWRHMPGDTVVEPWICAPKIVTNSGMGVSTREDTIAYDPANAVVSHGFIPQIKNEDDIERIAMPTITHH